MTEGDKFDALLKRFKYLKAKDKLTGSSTSKLTASSFFSGSYFCFKVIEPEPFSPTMENLTNSFDVSILTS